VVKKVKSSLFSFLVVRDISKKIDRLESILKHRVSCREMERMDNKEEYRSFPSLPVIPDEKKTILEELAIFSTSAEGVAILTLCCTNALCLIGLISIVIYFHKLISGKVEESIEMIILPQEPIENAPQE
jgi:hypothetical protein